MYKNVIEVNSKCFNANCYLTDNYRY